MPRAQKFKKKFIFPYSKPILRTDKEWQQMLENARQGLHVRTHTPLSNIHIHRTPLDEYIFLYHRLFPKYVPAAPFLWQFFIALPKEGFATKDCIIPYTEYDKHGISMLSTDLIGRWIHLGCGSVAEDCMVRIFIKGKEDDDEGQKKDRIHQFYSPRARISLSGTRLIRSAVWKSRLKIMQISCT